MSSKSLFFSKKIVRMNIDTIIDQPLKEIVIFAVNTGVRIGELVNIKWSHVDFNKKTVRISQKDGFETKSKKERTIPMNRKVYELLLSKERKGEYIFCRNDWEQREEHLIARKFKEYLKSIDLGDGFSFHSLRHTFASHLVQKGVSLYKVSKLLGHANIKTTEIYAHLAPETFHDVVRLLDGKDGGESPFYGIVGE